MKTEFVKFLVEEAVPLIRAGKATFEDIVLKFKAQFGREPEGVESIAIRKEFTKPEGKLVDMQGNTKPKHLSLIHISEPTRPY